jgi:hypothetical protein
LGAGIFDEDEESLRLIYVRSRLFSLKIGIFGQTLIRLA